MPRKKICKICKAKCCTCEGCNPDSYVDGICPVCQKKSNNAISSDKGMQELQQSQGITEISRVLSAESIT